jgi:mannosylglycerate hydrolase
VTAPAESRIRLHVIPYLDWEREGHETFDTQRALLLDILAQLLLTIDTQNSAEKLDHFLLGGQTILLDDIAAVRDELLTSLVIYNANGKLALGPWYVQADGLLADGESLVRNLLLARVDARRHGIKLLDVAYLPSACQHTAQLPQILRSFGISSAFLCLGNPVFPLPFQWQAPDGSQVLVMTYQRADTADQAINHQRTAQPDGPFLWMHHADHPDHLRITAHSDDDSIQSQQSHMSAYVADLRDKLPDSLRPTLSGEIHLQVDTPVAGRFSARITQKQEMARLQSHLVYIAEPLLALALTYGEMRFPAIQRALLEYSWRLLLQNQSRQTIAGAISDDVYDETLIRSRRIGDNIERIIDTALTSLDGERTPKRKDWTTKSSETYITVWNPHGHAVRQVTELVLNLPPDRYPSVLTNPNGDERAFSWDASTNTLGFLADVPPVGYAVYTLRLSEEKTAAYNQKRTVAARTIGSASGESLGINTGLLDWTFDGRTIHNFLTYHDGGDAGDIWHYATPDPDVLMTGNLVDVVQVEATPTYERLIFRNRMRIAPNLYNGTGRKRGLRVLDLMTTATYYNELPGVHFRTRFSNNAEDHRLRAHIRTGLETSQIYTDSAFGMTQRPSPTADQPVSVQSMHSVTALYENQRGMAIFTRGLHAYEPHYDDGQVTVALTLLRAVGWLNKAQRIEAQGAQLPTDIVNAFMLMPLQGEHDAAYLMRHAQTYRAPLRAVQYDEKPRVDRHSYLHMDDERVILTSLKPPQDSKGLIVRLLNPTPTDIGFHLRADGTLVNAQRLNMAEESQEHYPIENNRVNVRLAPYQVVTVRLGF